MKPIEIKVLIMQRGVSLTDLANRWDCHIQELSMCIHRRRGYPRLRKKLAKYLGIPVKQLFGDDDQMSRGKREETRAA